MELAEAFSRIGDASAAASIYGRMLKDNPADGVVLRALNKLPKHQVAPLLEPAHNGHAAAGIVPEFQSRINQASAMENEAIISRFEALLVHSPRNIRALETLGAAYARKKMFDKALECYQRALRIAGNNNLAIRQAISETTLQKFDAALGKLDSKARDYADKREQLQNKRLEFERNTMDWPS